MDIAIAGALNSVFPMVGEIFSGGEKEAVTAAEKAAAKAEAGTPAEALRKTASKAARSGKPEKIQSLAELVDADQSIIDAANRLGFSTDELLPSHYSNNTDMRTLVGLLASRQGSGLKEQENQLLEGMTERIKDFITDHGGSMDASEVSAEFKQSIDSARDELRQIEEEKYGDIDNAIPAQTRIDADNTLRFLDKLADNRGGGIDKLNRLKGKEKEISDYLGKESPSTYFGFNEYKQDVGRAYGKAKGMRTTEERELAQLYHVMRDDLKAEAEKRGMGDTFEEANKASSSRFALDKAARGLLGDGELGDLMPKVEKAVNDLSKGDMKEFRRVMGLLPDEYKQRALITALGKMFSKGSKVQDILSLPDAVNWLRDVKGNSQAWKALTDNLPEEAVNELNDIYTMFSGVRRARQSFEADTGNKIHDFQRLLDESTGIPAYVAKHPKTAATLKQGAKVAATSLGNRFGGSVGSVLANNLLEHLIAKMGGSIAPELDRLMATPEFSKLITTISERDPLKRVTKDENIKAGHLQRDVGATPEWKAFYKKVPQPIKQAISKKGLALFLFNEMRASNDQKSIQ